MKAGHREAELGLTLAADSPSCVPRVRMPRLTHPHKRDAAMTDIQQKASEILDVGVRWGPITDNYEQRMDVFASELQNLSPAERAQLFDEILNQDSGALHSWLTVDRLNLLVGDGTITGQERDAIFDAFGEAYVNGSIDFEQAREFVNVMGDATGPLANEANINALLGTLTGANGPNSTAFIEKFSREFLQNHVLVENMPDPQGRAKWASMLLNALEQSGGTQSVHNMLSGLTPDQRSQLRDEISQYGAMYDQAFGVPGNVRDPMAILIDTTSAHGTREEVVEMVRFIGSHSNGNGPDNHYFSYDNKPFGERAEALSGLFLAHSDEILNDLTVADPSQTPGSTNENSTTVGTNLAALSNLIRMTGLNPDNSRSKEVMAALGDFAAENIRIGNMSDSTDVNGDGVVDGEDKRAVDAGEGRTAMIGAAMQDAVASGYVDLRADQAARDAFMGFVIDLAVSAIPVGGKFAAGPISDAVSEALGGLSEGVRDAIAKKLSELGEGLLTDAQGQLTDAAKKAIIDALPEDYSYLEGIKNDSNTFIQDVILGSTNFPYEFTEAMSDYGTYIDQAKGQ